MSTLRAAELIRNIQDFPVQGVLFRDITPVLLDPDAMGEVIHHMIQTARTLNPDVIAGIESRGFLFGVPIAQALEVGFVPIRKPGKLPYDKISETYSLEYGTNTIEMHTDAVTPGQRVLIVDDLLATGGTTRAACNLVERGGGTVAGVSFVIELNFLHGRKLLDGYSVHSLIQYD